MGCDIHFFVEKKQDGKWVSADTWERDEDCEDEEDEDQKAYYCAADEFYGDRNYALFGILADVRNGRSYFNPNATPYFNTIAAPKGIPDDLSPEVANHFEHWQSDAHSYSWLSLTEILNFDWTQTYVEKQDIPFENWCHWHRSKKYLKEPYTNADFKTPITVISEEDAIKIHEALTPNELHAKMDESRHIFVTTTWNVLYSEYAKEFWTNTIPRLLKLAGNVIESDNVRVVFFFDN